MILNSIGGGMNNEAQRPVVCRVVKSAESRRANAVVPRI